MTVNDPYDNAHQRSMHWERVRQFMLLAGQAAPGEPAIPDQDTRRLRAALILEEALETITALGFRVVHDRSNGIVRMDDVTLEHAAEPSLVEIADGCADLQVVTTGTLIACGLKDNALLRVVDENNLAKFGPGGYRRPDGKWVKPPGHQPPPIAAVLQAQGYRATLDE